MYPHKFLMFGESCNLQMLEEWYYATGTEIINKVFVFFDFRIFKKSKVERGDWSKRFPINQLKIAKLFQSNKIVELILIHGGLETNLHGDFRPPTILLRIIDECWTRRHNFEKNVSRLFPKCFLCFPYSTVTLPNKNSGENRKKFNEKWENWEKVENIFFKIVLPGSNTS